MKAPETRCADWILTAGKQAGQALSAQHKGSARSVIAAG